MRENLVKMSKKDDFFSSATQAYIEVRIFKNSLVHFFKKRHWNVGRIIAEEMKPLQFEEIEDIAALIPEAELIIDYPSQDSIFLENIQNLIFVENLIQKT